MDEQETKEQLKAVLQTGVTVQTFAGMVTYAISSGKTDWLKELNDLLSKLVSSLTEEEKGEMKLAVDAAIDVKMKEVLSKMGEELSEEELAEALKMIEEISQQK